MKYNINNHVLLSTYFYFISILLLWKIEMISNYKCTFGLKEGEIQVWRKSKCQVNVNSMRVLFIYL
jgi:hypothetical protein